MEIMIIYIIKMVQYKNDLLHDSKTHFYNRWEKSIINVKDDTFSK